MPKATIPGCVRCIAKVSGKVIRAKGLLNSKLFGKSVPRCIVKGIKGNSHLVDFFCTDVDKGHDPTWDAKWDFNCLKIRSADDFVGLKFIVYDGEEFLGGADVDISELPEFRDMEQELELTGMAYSGKKGQAPKKARLFISISLERMVVPILGRPKPMLTDSMRSITRTTAICGRIVRARGIRSRSEPMCFVRCAMLSGRIIDIFHTKCNSSDMVDPHWNESFSFEFEDEGDQPLMLMFNIFGASELNTRDPAAIFQADDHLGSAMMPVDSIKDEQSFMKGEGRAKLRLLDECQQIEKRLDRDAGRAAREADNVEDAAANPTKKSWADKFGQASMSLPGFRGHKNTDKSSITVEMFADRQDTRMPHCELMNESMTVEAADLDITPDEYLRSYFTQVRDDGESVKRIEVAAEERIFTVYGRVNSAMDLISADFNGKSDPYVIVEALTTAGETLFVYRTRFIKSNLNPVWHEGFFWKVPADPENPTIPVALTKLQFSIYDTDEGQLLEGGEDDFLGRCNADISFMRNQDYICEDIPLLGVKARAHGHKSSGSFRRYSTLSAEVRVERRVVRIVSPKHNFDAALLDCPRHHESRAMVPPEVPVYRDHSQEEAVNDPGVHDSSAARILSLRDSNSLLEIATIHKRSHKQKDGEGWLYTRPIVSRNLHTAPAGGAGERPQSLVSLVKGLNNTGMDSSEPERGRRSSQPSYRRNWDVLGQDWNKKLSHAQGDLRSLDFVNRLPPMSRTGSLPMMASRFGEHYRRIANTMNPFEEDWFSNTMNQKFANHGDTLNTVMQNIDERPNFGNYTMRREISTAPGRLGTL